MPVNVHFINILGGSAGVRVQQGGLVGVLYPTQTCSNTTPLVEVIYEARNRVLQATVLCPVLCSVLANQTDDDPNICCTTVSRQMLANRCLPFALLLQTDPLMCLHLSKFKHCGSSFFFASSTSHLLAHRWFSRENVHNFFFKALRRCY